MLRTSIIVRWVPKYFKRSIQAPQRQRRGGPTIETTCGRDNKSYPSADARRETVSGHAKKQKARDATVMASKQRVPHPKAFSPHRTPEVRALAEKATTILRCFDQQKLEGQVFSRGIGPDCHSSGLSPSALTKDHCEDAQLRRSKDSLCFMGKTEVLAVLKAVLPPPPLNNAVSLSHSDCQRLSEPCGSSRSLLVAIPDDEAANVHGYLRRIRGKAEGKEGDITSIDSAAGGTTLAASMSLRDVTIFLQLYEAVESEDGALLLQLMGVLRRIVFSGHGCEFNEGSPKDTVGVVSQLLVVLSSLGLAEEHVLQRLVSSTGPFLTTRLVLNSKESNLIQLLVALHRFGFHHEKCYTACVRALQTAAHRDPLNSFIRHALLKRGSKEPAQLSKGGIRIPRCLNGLTVSDLLEALSGMALSLHRQKVVVDLLLATIVAIVLNEELAMTNKPHLRNPENIVTTADEHAFMQDWISARALQVQRAAKVSEQMELPHPVIPQLFERLAVRYRGLIVDGGDGDISPENVGFYDAVTADLIKVSRSK